MKRICCFVLLGVVGCGETKKSAAPPLAPPTQFQLDLAAFVKEAHKMQNLVEMGAPEFDRKQQGVTLRNVLAGLVPTSDYEQQLTKTAHQLEDSLGAYSSVCTQLALQRDPEYLRGKVPDAMIDRSYKIHRDTRERFTKYQQSANQLLLQLKPTATPQ